MQTKEGKASGVSQTRNSSLELLRIISMFLIVMHHYSVHGGFPLGDPGLTLNKAFILCLSFGGKIGSNCFVLITGYFMVNLLFKGTRLLKIVLQVLFYSLSISVVLILTGWSDFSVKTAVSSFLPVLFNHYWFAATYIALYILTPYINIFIKSIDSSLHKKLIYTLVILWCILPTFFMSGLASSYLGWFVTMYLIAAYFRLYPGQYTNNCKTNMTAAVIISLLICLSAIALSLLGTKFGALSEYALYFVSIDRLPVFLASIALFLGFKNLKMKSSKVVNTISATMFGVYLIHEHFLLRNVLWQRIFRNTEYIDSPYLVVHALAAIVSIFVVSVLVDLLRIKLLEKPLFKLIDKKLSGKPSSFSLLSVAEKFEGFLGRFSDEK